MSSPPLPSDRSFGTLFTVIFGAVGGYALWAGYQWYGWLLGLAVSTLLITLLRPALLSPFNRLWMRLAELLNHVVSPIVMGAIFFVVFTPIGWCMRVAGRDVMMRTFDQGLKSYWIERQPPGPDPQGLSNQF